jgi:shikimate dehydrogenase
MVVARHPNEGEHHFTDHNIYKNASIVFNATPVGMFPNNDDSPPINLSLMPRLQSVVDVIYNPLRSHLLMTAESLGKQAVNGLLMLIVQAIKAMELFHGKAISDENVLSYYHNTIQQRTNLVLIGMPMSGKTHYAKLLANNYNKKLVELDAEIERQAGMSIPELFRSEGESKFREYESLLVQETAKRFNQAISCGGGVVLNPDNIRRLKQNGIVLFLDMPLALLQQCNPRQRPLLKQRGALERLFQERYPLYLDAADLVIDKSSYDETEILTRIEVSLHEYFHS